MPPVVAGYLKLPMLLSYSILLLIEDLIQVYGWPTVMNIRHEINKSFSNEYPINNNIFYRLSEHLIR